MIQAVEEIVAKILERSSYVVVRYRLLRDVLKVPASSRELQDTRDALIHNQWMPEEGLG